MESIAIFPISQPDGERAFRAVSKTGQAEGRTVGEALDGACASFSLNATGTLVLIQPFQPDEWFPADRRARLVELMARWRQARDQGGQLPTGEQSELESLQAAELDAAIRRTEQVEERLAR